MRNLKKRKVLLFSISGAVLLIFLIFQVKNMDLIQPAWFVPKVKACNMMKDISPQKVKGIEADRKFITNTADFSIELLKSTISKEDNALISPVSLMLPLAMTANGAGGNTLTQINHVLSKDIPLSSLNEYLYSFQKSLKSSWNSKLKISNSIWFRDTKSLKVKKDFLQTNVVLDRPFVYAIIDTKTNIPIFLGVVTDMNNIGK